MGNTFPTSAFIRAAALTRPQKTPPRVYVYVEDDIDTVFWRTILEASDTGCTFVIKVYQVSDREMRGKDAMMRDLKEGSLELGNRLLLCLDSDLDLIVDNYHIYTDEFRKSPYIISTLWYSMENLKCYYKNVQSIIYKVTLTDEIKQDVKQQLLKVSKLIYELFLMTLVSYQCKDNYYSLDQLGKDINNLSFEETGELTKKSIIAIESIRALHNSYIMSKKIESEELESRLSRLGCTTETVLYFMRGHDVEEKVINPYVKAVAIPIRTRKMSGIGGSMNNSDYKNQLRQQYSNQTGVTDRCCLGNRICDLIRDCDSFENLPVYDDLRTLVKKAIAYGDISAIMGALLKQKVK